VNKKNTERFSSRYTPPSLPDVLARPRLLDKLENLKHQPGVWVSSPPGASEGESLARLTLEYLLGIPSFSRNFFQSLYSLFEDPFVIVFDNYQELSVQSLIQDCIAGAIDLLPAGLILMLKGGGAVTGVDVQSSQKAAFSYFAGEILRHEPEQQQDLVILSSLFPSFTLEMLGVISSLSEVEIETTLERMYRSNYFTERHERSEISYQYHPMFREYLSEEFKRRYTESDSNQYKVTAATLLIDHQQMESAAELLMATKNWEKLADLCLRVAQDFLTQGKNHTLLIWLNELPAYVVEQQPWLRFYLASSKSIFDPARAREYFGQALSQFKMRQPCDYEGIYQSWAGAIDTFNLEWDDMLPVLYWLQEYQKLQAEQPGFPSIETECCTLSGLLNCVNWQPQFIDKFPGLVQRCTQLLYLAVEPNQQVGLGSALLVHYMVCGGQVSDKVQVISYISSQISDERLWVSTRLFWFNIEGLCNVGMGNFEKSVSKINTAFELIESGGVHILDITCLATMVYGLLINRRLAEAEQRISQMEMLVQPTRRLDVLLYLCFKGWLQLFKNQLSSARPLLQSALQCAEDISGPFAKICSHYSLMVIDLSEKEIESAEHHLAKLAELERATHSTALRFNLLLARAYLAQLDHDSSACEGYLGEALHFSIKNDVTTYPFGIGASVFRSLYELALIRGIEVEQVQKLIRIHNILPEKSARSLVNWPWPVQINSFGRLEITKDGVMVDASRKLQRKPMGLLTLLIFHHGKKLPVKTAIEHLWPDYDGDKAENNFKMALSRLRKITGKETIRQEKGFISINTQLCRVDAWVFTDFAAKKMSTVEQAVQTLDAVTQMYSEEFYLVGDAFWETRQREELRNLFTESLVGGCEILLEKQMFEEVFRYCKRALDLYPSSEAICFQVLKALSGLQRYSEAKSIYTHLKHELHKAFKREPSDEIQEFCEALTGL
jgi:two-component SAPR family response regulator